MKVYKKHDERKKEIMDIAEGFFASKGYVKTSVSDILREIGIARGTFYHYFKSKEEVLDAIITGYIKSGVAVAKQILKDSSLSVHEKFLKIIMAQKPDTKKQQMIDELHKTPNAEMHQKSLIEIVKHLTPILTQVVEEGIEKGLFSTPYPQESIEFLLVSSAFIFDDNIFDFSKSEFMKKTLAFIHTMEIILGAKPNSFAYMIKAFNQVSDV